jgi:hypothetical protein
MNQDEFNERLKSKNRDFAGADLRGIDFTNVNDLTGANLREANLRGVELICAALRYANLTGADLREADLTDADLREANLTGADLREANLTDAILCEADLTGADLTGADLTGADFTGVNFTGAPDWQAAYFNLIADLRENEPEAYTRSLPRIIERFEAENEAIVGGVCIATLQKIIEKFEAETDTTSGVSIATLQKLWDGQSGFSKPRKIDTNPKN